MEVEILKNPLKWHTSHSQTSMMNNLFMKDYSRFFFLGGPLFSPPTQKKQNHLRIFVRPQLSKTIWWYDRYSGFAMNLIENFVLTANAAWIVRKSTWIEDHPPPAYTDSYSDTRSARDYFAFPPHGRAPWLWQFSCQIAALISRSLFTIGTTLPTLHGCGEASYDTTNTDQITTRTPSDDEAFACRSHVRARDLTEFTQTRLRQTSSLTEIKRKIRAYFSTRSMMAPCIHKRLSKRRHWQLAAYRPNARYLPLTIGP